MCEDGTWLRVWKNERVDNNLSPVWPQARISMLQLCNNDIMRPLRFEIFDFESSGKHQSMGCFDTSVQGLLQCGGNPFTVIEPEKKKNKKGYVNSGTFKAEVFVEHHPTFTDVSTYFLFVLLSLF
jgi:hypothetical protein